MLRASRSVIFGGWWCLVSAFAAATACSAGGGGTGFSSGGSSASSGSGGSSASGGSGGTLAGGTGGSLAGGSGGSIALDGGGASGGSGGLSDGGECAATTTKGEQVPVDLMIMLDKSGSMLNETANGTTKWDAVKGALTSFLNTAGAGIGVGIQYFPLDNKNIPNSCTANSQCTGSGNACLLKTCSAGTSVTACVNNADCVLQGLGQCVPLGKCAVSVDYYCAATAGALCSANPGDTCVALTTSTCLSDTSCVLGDYQVADVEIGALPGNAALLIASLEAQEPNQLTPTGPALQGAIDHAKSYGASHADHKLAVVLVTDGFPTECNPQDIGQIAALASSAASGSPAVPTFVIGVFTPAEKAQAQQNFNQIAQGGGTAPAFVIDTNQNVTQAFLDALKAIQGQALTCEFQIPLPAPGETLDFGKVNVEFTSGGSGTKLYYVGDASQCNPQTGGWYYDVDPQTGGTPTKILVCPGTCDVFKVTTGGQVDIKLGCATEVPPA